MSYNRSWYGDDIYARSVNTTNLVAENLDVETIGVDDLTVTNLTATSNANIANLTAANETITNSNIATLTNTDLTSTNIDATNIITDTFDATNATAATLNVVQLNSGNITVPTYPTTLPPPESSGSMAFIQDTSVLYVSDGSMWIPIGGVGPGSLVSIAGQTGPAVTMTEGQGINITATGNDIKIDADIVAGTGISITNSPYTISATTGVSPGTLTNSTLRWDGSEWAENTLVKSEFATLTLGANGSSGLLTLEDGNVSSNSVNISSLTQSADRTITIPDPGTTVSSFVLTDGAQTVNGLKTFSSQLKTNTTSNQLALGTGTSITTITSPATGVNRTYTMPDTGTSSSSFIMADGAQTVNGQKTFASSLKTNLNSNQVELGTGANMTTITSVQTTGPKTFTIPNVTSGEFVMTTGTQSISGTKTFSAPVTFSTTTGQIVLGSGTTTTVSSPTPLGNRIYTIPDVGTTTADFVMTESAQNINGAKTFGSQIAITATGSQLVLGTTQTTTIHASTPSASRIYFIDDAGATARFIMSEGAQTINGLKTFGSALTTNATGSQIVLAASSGSPTTITSAQTGSKTFTIPNTPASTANFIMSESAQTINGIKTFSTGVSIISSTNQLTLGTGNTATITSTQTGSNKTFTIPNVASGEFVMSTGTQTFTGSTTFTQPITISATSNQLVLGTTLTINSQASGTKTYHIPNTIDGANFVMTEGTQTINGAKTFGSQLKTSATSNQLELGGTFTSTITSSQTVNNKTFTIPDIASSDFVLTEGTQTINGAKTFGSQLKTSTTSNQIALGSGNITTITSPAPSGTRTYTIQDVGTSTANFIMSELAQTINGLKTFSSALTSNVATNQIVIGSSFTATINSSQTSNKIFTIPDIASSDFVLTEGAQTINGVKTFSDPLKTTLSSNQIELGSGNLTTISSIQTGNKTFVIPNVASAEFMMTEGAQTINGVKTFTSALTSSATSNQLVLAAGTGNQATISSIQTGNKTFTIPNVTSSNFVMTESPQTINGGKTFTGATTFVSIIANTNIAATALVNQLTIGGSSSTASQQISGVIPPYGSTLNLRTPTTNMPSSFAFAHDTFLDTGTAVFTATISGITMTVSGMTSGIILLGSILSGSGVTTNTVVTAFGTGTGNTGTYTISPSQSIGSPTTITSTGGVSNGRLRADQTPLFLNNYKYANTTNWQTGTTGGAIVTAQKARLSDYKLATLNTSVSVISGTNISGGCYNPGQDSMLHLNNTGDGTIYETTLDCSTLIRTITFDATFNDPEDICWMYDNMFAIAHNESGGANSSNIVIFRLPNGNSNITINFVNSYLITPSPAITHPSGQGMKGITYNPDLNVFYCVIEGAGVSGGDPPTSCQFLKMNMNGTYSGLINVAATYTSGNNCQMSNFTGCYYDRNTKTCFITSSLSQRTIEIWPETDIQNGSYVAGQIVGRIEGLSSQNPTGSALQPYVPFATGGSNLFESISFSPDSKNMFMTSEPKQFAHYQYWPYKNYQIDDNNHRPQFLSNWLGNPTGSPSAATASSMTLGLCGNILDQIADSSSATTSTFVAMLNANGVNGVSLPAQYLTAGKTLKIKANGTISTTGIATVTFTLRHNTTSPTTICTTPVATVCLGSNSLWSCDAIVNVRSATSSTATVIGEGVITVNEAGSIPIYRQTTDKTVTGTSQTSLVDTTGAFGTTTLPANFLTVGRTIMITASGYRSTTNAFGRITFDIKIGSTTVLTTGAVVQDVLTTTNKLFFIEAMITCRSTGVSGTVFSQGRVALYDCNQVPKNIFLQTADGTIAGSTSTSPTAITSTGLGTLNLPNDFWSVGRTLQLRGSGTRSAGAGTLTIRVLLNSNVMASTGAITTSVDVPPGKTWSVDCNIVCRTLPNNVATTFAVTGLYTETGTTPQTYSMNLTTPTVDTTGFVAVSVTAQWSSNNANNIITMTNFTLDTVSLMPLWMPMVNTSTNTINTTTTNVVDTFVTWQVGGNSITMTDYIMDAGSSLSSFTFPMLNASTASLTNTNITTTTNNLELVAQVNSGTATITGLNGYIEVAS